MSARERESIGRYDGAIAYNNGKRSK